MSDEQVRGRPVYSIGAVARMLGVPAGTLRTWQERYGVVVPERSEGGHRLYTRDQVEQLRFLVDQVAAGLSPADVHRLLEERLAQRGPLETEGGVRDRLLILLAERDGFAADFTEYFLRTEGYEVALAMDFEDSLRQAESTGPQLAVVDLLIPGGSGIHLCERLSGHNGVPVIAISTLEMRDRAMAAGASAFLLKPIEPLQLASAIKDLLGRSAFLQRSERRRDGV